MKRPVLRNAGYTLIEILVATSLSLILLGAVIAMFGRVGTSITNSRSMLEATDRLRLAGARLQLDLGGVTATMLPPRRPDDGEGYFEYMEGPVGVGIWPSSSGNFGTYANQVMLPYTIAQDSSGTTSTPNLPPDTTVGDFDDILMFTTRSTAQPFVGKIPTSIIATGTIQSDVAEVAWFVRGRALHRRVLLVAPSVDVSTVPAPYYANCDVSARLHNGVLKANTLGDLTCRDFRYAHPTPFPGSGCEFFTWILYAGSGVQFPFPTLPTLYECSTTGWGTEYPASSYPNFGSSSAPIAPDFWSNNSTRRVPDNAFVTGGSRVSDDIILTNVIGFDVKVWDPHVAVQEEYYDTNGALQIVGIPYLPGQAGYSLAYSKVSSPKPSPTHFFVLAAPGAYVDLGYAANGYGSSQYNGYFNSTDPASPKVANSFGHTGDTRSGLAPPNLARARVYDTYSTSHEDPRGHDGLDNDGNGLVDDNLEKVAERQRSRAPSVSRSLAWHPGEDSDFRAGQPPGPRSDRGPAVPAARTAHCH